eukprot:m.199413 g.199413  ORF g.199413 m.199413 type:complete len:537 (+) comp32732_c2_seq2:122-1732(+)
MPPRGRNSSSFDDYELEQLTFADTIAPKARQARINWITAYFLFFCFLCLFDMSSDIFMMYTIRTDQQKMLSFYDNHLADLPFTNPNCVFDGGACGTCNTAINTSIEDGCGFCRAGNTWDGFVANTTTNDRLFKCGIDEFRNNLCTIKSDFKAQLDELNNIWIAYVVLISLSVFFTSYYFYQLFKKWRGKLSLVPLAHDGLIDPSTGLKIPYYAPPQEEWPGRLSAPTFVDQEKKKKDLAAKKPEQRNVQLLQLGEEVVVCPGCMERDRIGEVFCRTCGKKQGEIGLQGMDQTDRLRKKKELHARTQQRQEKIKAYFSSFMSVAGTRMVMLMVEDMPQGLLAVLYVNTMDKTTGLECVRNIYNYENGGNLPDVGTAANRTALWLLFAGQACSLILLMMQVLYIKGQQTKQQKISYSTATFCGTDALLLFIIIPGVLCPVLIAFLVTDVDLVLGVTSASGSSGFTAFIVLVVITVVFSLPWLAMLIFGCVAFADVTGLDTFCTGACFPVEGAEACGGDCCDCCGCDNCSEMCCCFDCC